MDYNEDSEVFLRLPEEEGTQSCEKKLLYLEEEKYLYRFSVSQKVRNSEDVVR